VQTIFSASPPLDLEQIAVAWHRDEPLGPKEWSAFRLTRFELESYE
jgi:hypothetical protein